MSSFFNIEFDDKEKMDRWVANHNCKYKYLGAIGGRFTYCFTPTGLGVITKVKCACGAELDVTPYEDW